MNRYIWTEMQNNCDKEIKYTQEREYVSLSQEINSVNKENISVNLARRFPFMLYKGISEYINESEFDVLMHYIADLDLKSGYECVNMGKDIIENDINNKRYGKKVKNLYNSFDRETKDNILDCIYKYEKGSVDGFISAIKNVIKECLIYKGKNTVIVYIDIDENEEINKLIELCKIMFLPVCFNLKIHYKYHMGIIGTKSTMRIGKIRIL